MMTAQLSLGPVPFGQTARAEHPQFGKVALHSDGNLDSFNHAEGTNLVDEGMLKFIAGEARLARNSLNQARANFEAGVQPDPARLNQEHREQMTALLRDCGLPGSVYTTTDHRGVMTACHLHHLDGYHQSFEVHHGATGTLATLNSRVEDGRHFITCPVKEDGQLNLNELTEKVTLTVPWLYEEITDKLGEQAIRSVEDERLARLTQAAELGLLLPVKEMGEGWKSREESGCQILTLEHSHQTVVLDPQQHQLCISASAWLSRGDFDREAADRVVYQNGKFSKSHG